MHVLRARVHGCGHAWRWRACMRARLRTCVPAYVLPACVRPPRFTILFVPHALFLHPDKTLDYTFLLCATFLFRTAFWRKPVPYRVDVRACVRARVRVRLRACALACVCMCCLRAYVHLNSQNYTETQRGTYSINSTVKSLDSARIRSPPWLFQLRFPILF